MRYSHKDKKDQRVVRHSTYPLEFPAQLDQLPDGSGVFVLIDGNDDVVCVDHAGEVSMREAVDRYMEDAIGVGVERFRWFLTADRKSAADLAMSWRAKYIGSRSPILRGGEESG